MAQSKAPPTPDKTGMSGRSPSVTKTTLPDGSTQDFPAAIIETVAAISMATTRNNTAAKLGFDKLPCRLKQMLLFLGSKDGVNPVAELSPDVKEFFDQDTTTEAYQLLRDRLQDRKVGSSLPTMVTKATAHYGKFVSSIARIPGNVTIFGFPKTV